MRLIVKPSWAIADKFDSLTKAIVCISTPPWVYSPPKTALSIEFEDSIDGTDRMLDYHAMLIWDYVSVYRDWPAIIVSCDAGVSRSPSVAMAIADHYKLGRKAIDWFGRDPNGPPPNEWVYDTMMKNAPEAK